MKFDPESDKAEEHHPLLHILQSSLDNTEFIDCINSAVVHWENFVLMEDFFLIWFDISIR